MRSEPTNGRPQIGVVQRAFTWYAQQADHPAKLRIVDWLRALLGIRVVIAPTLAGWMKLDLLDFAQRAIFLDRVYEPATLALVTRLLKSGDCFVDVGANVGQYSLAASKIVGKTGRVIAIEADPFNFEQLAFNLRLNKVDNVLAMLGAAHGSSDFLPFNSPDVNKGVARVDARRQNGHFLVCGFAMAELLRDQKISDVAVAKLDIEGHELEALKGLLKTESALPHHIVLEFWGGEPSHPEMTNDRVVQYLESKGYQITLIDGSPFKPNGEIPESNLWAHLKADAQY